MCVCNKCSVELVVGENWYASSKKISDYKCKKCNYKKSRKWIKSNKDQYYNSQKIHRESEGVGVYLVKYRWINFYVGEGQYKIRKEKHLKHKYSFQGSRVAKLVEERNLDRSKLTFIKMYNCEDEIKRKQMEDFYRRELKPYINPLD